MKTKVDGADLTREPYRKAPGDMFLKNCQEFGDIDLKLEERIRERAMRAKAKAGVTTT